MPKPTTAPPQSATFTPIEVTPAPAPVDFAPIEVTPIGEQLAPVDVTAPANPATPAEPGKED